MRSTIDVILRLLVLTTSPTGVWPFGETFSEQHNLFLPYDQDMLCNEGTRWSCFCSASSKMNQSSLCAFNFDHLQAVGVQFDGCSLQLNRTVRHDQSYEQFIKDYLAWWIREECSIANCFGVEQTRISNLNSSQIVFIQAECSFADVNITRLSFVVAADSNAEQPNWIPASTVASILNARLHLLQNILSTDHLVIETVIIHQPAPTLPPTLDEIPQNEQPTKYTPIHIIYLTASLAIAIVLIAWAYSCYIFTRLNFQFKTTKFSYHLNRQRSMHHAAESSVHYLLLFINLKFILNILKKNEYLDIQINLHIILFNAIYTS
ncbi:hypothetical protein Tsp_03944 [Trichinella spiralis]|uniref:hypothetical protein n=1 Tax=Trichinella spiralis TaxID=6334 RepID=UPI0001EFC8F3|nr:hypothetical protein Tsp_03944 [Trichinella spiralis]